MGQPEFPQYFVAVGIYLLAAIGDESGNSDGADSREQLRLGGHGGVFGSCEDRHDRVHAGSGLRQCVLSVHRPELRRGQE